MKPIVPGLTSRSSNVRALLAILWLFLLSPWTISTGRCGVFSYEVTNSTVTITKYNSTDPNVDVPDTLDSLPVTRIGISAFTQCPGLSFVILPNSVTNIGAGAFTGCKNLKNIHLPTGLIAIESQAFSGCTGLTNIDLPDTVVVLGHDAFANCSSLKNFKLPHNLTSIADNTFSSSLLGSVTLPDSVTNIGANAFFACGITNLELGHGIVAIGPSAFSNARHLRNLVVPDNVTQMGDSAFAYCHELTDVTIGNGLAGLGSTLFAGCSNLVNLQLGSNLKNIGFYAFFNCTALANLNLPDSLTKVDSGAFSGCSSLESLHLGKKVASIEDNAFTDCVSLTDLILPDSVAKISDFAFDGCTALANITFGAKLATFSASAFNGCLQITRFTVDYANTKYSGIDGILFNKSQSQLLMCPPTRTGSYAIPSGATSIAASAFANCASLTNLSIPDSVISIGDLAFDGCNQLSSVTLDPANASFAEQDGILFNKAQKTLYFFPRKSTGSYVIPSGVTTIATCAFSHCAGLTNISLPDGLTTIKANAFDSCTSLTAITLPQSVSILDLTAFNGCTQLTNITVDAKNTHYSSRSGMVFTKDQKTLLLCPRGMEDPVSLPAALRSIGDNAFNGCVKLRSITLPNQVTDLGYWAFANCTALTNVVMGAKLATINYGAFLHCTGLVEMHFFGNPPNIGPNTINFSMPIQFYYLAANSSWTTSIPFMGTDLATWTPTFAEGAEVYSLAEKYPNACGEQDDADQDGMTNANEIAAGTDPTDKSSFLAFEAAARPQALSDMDKTPLDSDQLGLYFRSVPGKFYDVYSSSTVNGPWILISSVASTTTQTRIVRFKPSTSTFYRIAVQQ